MITANLFMFVILAVVILGSAIMCVFTKRIMRA
ncbi:NADH-quinone oxidoreductase subunit J, partial [Pseudoalteromonas aurantia]